MARVEVYSKWSSRETGSFFMVQAWTFLSGSALLCSSRETAKLKLPICLLGTRIIQVKRICRF